MIDHLEYRREVPAGDAHIEVVEGKEGPWRDKAFVFFSGRQFGRGMFHFNVTAMKLGRPYLCVRDVSNCWYNTPDYSTVLNQIRDWLDKLNFPQHVFVGSSMGAFGAMKFGLDLFPNRVIAFAPQNHPEVAGIDIVQGYKNSLLPVETDIYYCTKSNMPEDIELADALQHEKGITVHPRDCDTHQVMDLMHNSGELYKLLEEA